jgi:hypothetical protein
MFVELLFLSFWENTDQDNETTLVTTPLNMALFSSLNPSKKAVAEDKERRKSFGIGGAGNIRMITPYHLPVGRNILADPCVVCL